MSFATNRSIRPSLLMSAATTPHAFPERLRDSRFLADIRERAVAVIVEQPGGQRTDTRVGMQYQRSASSAISAELVLRLAEVDELADEQIQPAIIVVVEPDRAGAPAGRGDARLFRTSVNVPSPLLWYRMLRAYCVTYRSGKPSPS